MKKIYTLLFFFFLLSFAANAKPKHKLAKKPGLVATAFNNALGIAPKCAGATYGKPQPKGKHKPGKARKKSKRQF